MIFQEPVTSLNPCFTVGYQVGEVLKVHTGLDRKARRARAIELLEQVGIPDPERRLRAFPHQLSGGMCQRVMIAYALASEPSLLIADEPTTALDVTVQLQIIQLLSKLRQEHGLTLILITHNLSVIAELCDRVLVMYLGRIVEEGPVVEIFDRPRHPYTVGLLASRPSAHMEGTLAVIPGSVPDLRERPAGCPFHPRCSYAQDVCSQDAPAREPTTESHFVECHFWRETGVGSTEPA
jgi:oligopeptide/dipeptide ABC transporter ATP-binding protein